MADPTDPTASADDSEADDAMDRRLRRGGDELRSAIVPLSGDAIDGSSATTAAESEVITLAASRRQVRRARLVTAVAVALVVAVMASVITYSMTHSDAVQSASGVSHGSGNALDDFLAELPDEPVDPHSVQLVAHITAFDSCDSLLDRLRRVGAEHVGSRGFGYFYGGPVAFSDSYPETAASGAYARTLPLTGAADSGGSATLGTNVQVSGVDEPDVVKAVGNLVYSLRGGRLHITDVTSRTVVSVTDLDEGDGTRRVASVDRLLVAKNVVVVIGRESVTSAPVEGDPSASTSSVDYLTITQLDAGDPSHPVVRTRSRVEGHLVDARLVGDQVRMVTGWSMSDIGFVVPTSPSSVTVALDANRRTLAASKVSDWIPEWDNGGAATPIVECPQVYLPDTFAGVSMTSMVNFTADGTFVPNAVSVLAPSDVVYSSADTVAVASTVWVDPADRGTKFDDWKSAVHRFDVSTASPRYIASGEVDGSIGTQFNFGEIGDALAVVSSKGSPWSSPPGSAALAILRAEGATLVAVGRLADLGSGTAGVDGVRFTATRAFVSAGFGNRLVILDVSDPAAPRRTAVVELSGPASYIHPISPERVVTLGTRVLGVASATHAELIDTADPSAPRKIGMWDVPWSSTPAAGDHHAFLEWPEAKWMAFDTQFQARDPREVAPAPEATFVSTEPGLALRAKVRPQRVTVTAPCPTLDPAPYRAVLGRFIGANVVLQCDSDRVPEFPGRTCSPAPALAPGTPPHRFICARAMYADVVRVLVVSGTPWMYTSESLESLDPNSFASTGAVPVG